MAAGYALHGFGRSMTENSGSRRCPARDLALQQRLAYHERMTDLTREGIDRRCCAGWPKPAPEVRRWRTRHLDRFAQTKSFSFPLVGDRGPTSGREAHAGPSGMRSGREGGLGRRAGIPSPKHAGARFDPPSRGGSKAGGGSRVAKHRAGRGALPWPARAPLWRRLKNALGNFDGCELKRHATNTAVFADGNPCRRRSCSPSAKRRAARDEDAQGLHLRRARRQTSRQDAGSDRTRPYEGLHHQRAALAAAAESRDPSPPKKRPRVCRSCIATSSSPIRRCSCCSVKFPCIMSSV